jgi:hypothetical protein
MQVAVQQQHGHLLHLLLGRLSGCRQQQQLLQPCRYWRARALLLLRVCCWG